MEIEQQPCQYIGLALLSNIIVNSVDELHDCAHFNEIETAYLLAVELNNAWAMEGLAKLYEKFDYPHNLIVRYYEMALSIDTCCTTLYNIGDYYNTIGDNANMEKYFSQAVDEFDDVECMFILAFHYQRLANIEQMRMYYLLAVYNTNMDDKFHGLPRERYYEKMTKLDPFIILDILLSTQAHADDECNRKISFHLQELRSQNQSLNVYSTKVVLFERLGNVVECGVCYETLLNIDLGCGHCVCTDCYKKVYNTRCPFCRH